jgi:hypothetical protein
MTPVLADAGIPMIGLQLPAMVALLIPVVLLEAFVVSKQLRIGFVKAICGVFPANLVSTLVGFPIAWGVMLGIEFMLLGAYHVFPSIEGIMDSPVFQLVSLPFFSAWLGDNPVMVPVAAAVLLIPSFFISIWIERKICTRIWVSEPSINLSSAQCAVRQANIVSYLFLFGVAACLQVYVLTYGWPNWHPLF